jgi:uncharacterized membrane protein
MWPTVRFNVIGDAWRMYWRHVGVWSLAILIVVFSYSAISGVVFELLGVRGPAARGGFRLPMTPGVGAIHYLVSTLIGFFFQAGLIRMASNQVRGYRPRLKDLFSGIDVGAELLLAAAIYGAATFLGHVLCIVPGLIVSGLLMFTIPLVVIARQPAMAAIGQSWNALKSQWLTAAVFHFALALVSGSGMLLCCVGVLFTAPLYSLSIAILYHEFFTAAPAKTPPTDPFAEF